MAGPVSYPPTGPSSFPDVFTAAQQIWNIFRYEVFPPFLALGQGAVHLIQVLTAELQKILHAGA